MLQQNARVYIGTYTENILHGTGNVLHGKGKGIYTATLNTITGKIIESRLEIAADNPSFLCISPEGKYLYAVNELKEYKGQSQGSVSSYKIIEDKNRLEFLNKVPTKGTDPCYVVTSYSGKSVAVTNFTSGSLCIFRVQADGSLAEELVFRQHRGASLDPIRQMGPHAHSAMFDKNDRYVYIPDLGLDEVVIYHYNEETTELLKVSSTYVKPGAGPRYCEMHPYLDICYLINELDSTIYTYKWNSANGELEFIQAVSTITDSHKKTNISAALHVTPDGKFLYGSNRGDDSIVIFSVDKNGKLRYVGHEASGGCTPRDFTIVADGAYLIVANQDSDNISVFKRNIETGKLTLSCKHSIPTPVCVVEI